MAMDLFEAKAGGWDERPVPARISAAVGPLVKALVEPTMRVLDFGAGTGLVTGHVAPHVAHVAAVDLSPSMLAKLTEKPELAGKVTPYCQDLLEKPLGERFDGIVSAMALHHVQDTAAILRAFREHLKPGGFVALADLDVEDGSFHAPGTEGVFHHGFDRDALRVRLEEAGFVDIDFRTAVEVHKEGGAYSVFFVTARRDAGT
jgi:2-polyprenyl-3-methyl-5-hydroxy-6-metoxy-1,4-benzoquinol methylase